MNSSVPPPLVDRAMMISRSLRCFKLGCFGLIPVIGLPAAVLAFFLSNRVLQAQRHSWNAARPHLVIGLLLAGIGIVLSFGILCLVVVASFNAASGG